jgi:hypothetical protein
MGPGSRVSTVAVVAGAVVLVGLGVIAGLRFTAEPATRTIAGMITVVESEFAKFDRDVHDGLDLGPMSAVDAARVRCTAMGTDAHVLPGQPVVMFDEDGAELGRGQLGLALPVRVVDKESGRPSMSCQMPFKMEATEIVAAERKGIVSLEIGSRGRRSYTLKDLESSGWNLEVRPTS